ncbi:MAG: hypothetical protein F6K23_03265 [Okeania sp. SIO2C9]|uniref:arylsulfotransferase family protein n=1 Tax=Okeania sp. SIO2C9 TaxID=2607791 RepID=UPI0013BEE378|nr:arylsulfotransferase family protein [Okeania sp. SIO2C9]NEQ72179.1 hypothetical protein [Okeania sp. SIO2C9]
MKDNVPKDNIPIFSFVMGTAFIAFLCGVIIVEYKIFPYSFFKKARQGVEALVNQQSSTPDPKKLHTFPLRSNLKDKNGGVTVFDRNKSYQGYTLFTAYDGQKCTNLLIDMEGNLIQEWYIKYSDVWGKKAPFLDKQFGDEWTCWQGTQLLPNGELVATFIDNGRPYCGGLVKLDLNSNVVWSLPKCTHHDVHLGNDGLFYVPGMYLLQDKGNRIQRYLRPRILPNSPVSVNFWKKPILKDVVIIASPDGEFLEEISLLEAFANSDYSWSFDRSFTSPKHASGDFDPTHLNDVELITEEWAKYHPKVEPGDLMVSVRNINAIAIIDRQTKLVKWLTRDMFSQQHDPDLLPNGNILIFDNWGKVNSEVGATRIIELDPKTQEIVWEYAGTKDSPLHAKFRGSQQPLPNGNILITESTGGRILEVNRDKEIVWEYVNKLSDDRVGVVIRAQRFAPKSLSFVGVAE